MQYTLHMNVIMSERTSW